MTMHTVRLKKRIWFAGGVVCVAALLIGQQWGSTAPDNSSMPGASPVPVDAAQDSANGAATIATAREHKPLVQTVVEQLPVPYPLETGKNGELLITPNIRETFDHFLALGSAEPIAATTARIKAHLQQQLHEPALSTALDLLDRYLTMKAALAEMAELSPQAKSDTKSLSAWMEQRNALMRNHLGEAYEAFYGAEHRHNEYTIAKLEILRDPMLDDAAKHREIEQMAAARFPDIQAGEQQAQVHLQLAKEEQELIKNGASGADIYNHRLAEFGPAAAERLQALDKRRKEWQQRVDAWQNQKNNILKYAGLSEQDKERELQLLADELFTKGEQKRLGNL